MNINIYFMFSVFVLLQKSIGMSKISQGSSYGTEKK